MNAAQPANAKRLAIKIDVETLRGTLQGVPRLVETLRRHQAGATFLFSLGPDHTGRALKRMLHGRARRAAAGTSLRGHYGLATLFYGTLIPAPDIGTRGAEVMRSVRDAGFEVGIHAWNHTKWASTISAANAQWTQEQLQLAMARFQSIFGVPAKVHGAAGWQMNAHAFRLTQRLGLDYCSDTRGTQPFIPIQNAEIIACPQIPTTLPTFDELIGCGDTDIATVARKLIEVAQRMSAPVGHVLSLQAELEGISLLPQFEEFLCRYKNEGIELLSLGAYLEAASSAELPRHRIETAELAGRPGTIAVQGLEFLA